MFETSFLVSSYKGASILEKVLAYRLSFPYTRFFKFSPKYSSSFNGGNEGNGETVLSPAQKGNDYLSRRLIREPESGSTAVLGGP